MEIYTNGIGIGIANAHAKSRAACFGEGLVLFCFTICYTYIYPPFTLLEEPGAVFVFLKNICLAALDLSCVMWDQVPYLWHVGFAAP